MVFTVADYAVNELGNEGLSYEDPSNHAVLLRAILFQVTSNVKITENW